MITRSIQLVALVLCLYGASYTQPAPITPAAKQAFIDYLGKLPHEGEFYTDESVKKSVEYLPVLFALTETDLAKHDIYPFAALSRGLAELRTQRRYAARHFDEIQHPLIKLFWAAVLFKEKASTPEIDKFLRSALADDDDAKTLKDMVGPDFEKFRARVEATRKKH